VGTRRLLILSYLFPPAGGVAVQRALSLSKYLPGCGFDVHVLTARNAAAPTRDPGLLAQVPAGVHIHSAFTPELPFAFRQAAWKWLTGGKNSRGPASPGSAPNGRPPLWKRLPAALVRRILCPEPEILWVPFALRAARRIVRRYHIDTVLVTVPPFSALVVGSALKREFPHLKLVTDFRDDWLRFYLDEFEYQRNEYTARRAARIEREAVERSDLAVVVTRSMLRDLRARYPDQDSRKFVFIPNGYDPARIPSREASVVRPPGRPKIVVSFIGTVYSASSARYYLDALESLPEDLRSQVETRFVGRVADAERSFLENRGVAIRTFGFLPQSEALVHMAEADYLLLTMTDAASLTGKLFEYLATGTPILAVAPEDGEVARILQETNAGWCAAPDDRAGLRRLLLETFENHRNGRNGFRPNWEAIRRYERPRLAAEFGKRIRDLS
jgi:glycosyltransferase involved in cell wall biosynthesis